MTLQITRSSWWCLEIFSGVLDPPICFISHSTSAGWRHQQPPTMQWGSNWQDVGCCYLILIAGRDIESDSIRLTTDISDSESAILYQYQSIYINISVYQYISLSVYQYINRSRILLCRLWTQMTNMSNLKCEQLTVSGDIIAYLHVYKKLILHRGSPITIGDWRQG